MHKKKITQRRKRNWNVEKETKYMRIVKYYLNYNIVTKQM